MPYLISALLPDYPQGSGLLTSQTVEAIAVFYINIILSFLGLLAVVVMIWGGVKMLSAAGNAEQFKSGRTILVGAVIGFLLVIVSFAVVATIISVFGTPGTGVAPQSSGPGLNIGVGVSF
ncbi:MAG: hypothetical protein A2V81_03660 [Candidatus Abawacabacteria bacterium RBG_16_42_10]|uniref:Uncharacterized protein n=1 Tax=Candidatus Abawacabacteria bacterium RBG_16_42_10 TaxID=1817814 RepID=A0A1F4XK24_9BACT|nr:MAG: hypothetical protein A2V81_03660 [Candidatus Abawacabacteria bacterium RBG_16_42_10]